ncbi:hypothetical protein [Hymenobacter sp. DG01]|uniref:hypothetical protein n=1 Tax=Hymenobacter sp. DG01 TaxID=2584940 RepID=UPI00112096F5|nr:hypothetical protein [Hymenobacter sp. DG01]
MENFTYEYVSGTVVSSQKHTQTHMYTEGGGGQITTGRNLVGDPVLRGKIEAPVIKSYNTTTHEIFLQLENGPEMSIKFLQDDIAVREGHKITLIAVFRAGESTGYYACLFNHNTRSTAALLSNLQRRELTTPYLKITEAPTAPPQEATPQNKGLLGGLAASYRKAVDNVASVWKDTSSEALYAYQNRNTDAPMSQYELDHPRALMLAQVINEALLRLQQ